MASYPQSPGQANLEARIKTDIIGTTVREEVVSNLDSSLFSLSLKVIQIIVFGVVRGLQ